MHTPGGPDPQIQDTGNIGLITAEIPDLFACLAVKALTFTKTFNNQLLSDLSDLVCPTDETTDLP
jgi:hypothetical protein